MTNRWTSIWIKNVAAAALALTGAAGCVPVESTGGETTGGLVAQVVLGLVGFAADFFRAALAAFLF